MKSIGPFICFRTLTLPVVSVFRLACVMSFENLYWFARKPNRNTKTINRTTKKLFWMRICNLSFELIFINIYPRSLSASRRLIVNVKNVDMNKKKYIKSELSIRPLEKLWKCFMSDKYANQWLGSLAKKRSIIINAKSEMKLNIAAIIGCWVKLEK